MRRIALSLFCAIISVISFAQSADEKIGDMMNNSQWFELRDFFVSNTDSVSPFLEEFAKAMLAHFFNDPTEAVQYSQSLINNYGSELDLGNVLSVSQLMALDLQKLGKNNAASEVLSQVLASTKQYLDTATVAQFDNQIARYTSLAKYHPYTVVKADTLVSIPLRIDTITIVEDKPAVVMAFLPDCKINNITCDIQFDTGAGMNVISTKRAKEMGLKLLDGNITARGTREVEGIPMAIADSLVMNGITIYDVPFLVMDISAGHELLDSHLKKSDIVIGFEVMNALKHVNLDFENSSITVGNHSFISESEQGNMMLANGNNILVRGSVNSQPILIHPDCGDASFGIFFGNSWHYMKSYLSNNQQPRKALIGGNGGFDEISIYKLTDIPLTIGSTTISIPQIDLSEKYDSGDECDVRIGLKTFKLFKSIAFDMERMIMFPTK